MPRRNWTESELIALLRVYCILPFGKMHSRNKDIIALSQKIDRTPSAVALKMVNFASLDPTIKAGGMSNASKLDKEVWEKFFNDIDYFMNDYIGETDSDGFCEAPQSLYEDSGEYFSDNTIILSKSRNGQNIFRKIVLASYSDTCAISGITDKRVLVASHIAPWASHESRRLDPRNGICLNALWDKAFDRGLISFSDSFEILYSNNITQNDLEIFSSMSPKFRPPEKFHPDCKLLEAHRKKFGFDNQK